MPTPEGQRIRELAESKKTNAGSIIVGSTLRLIRLKQINEPHLIQNEEKYYNETKANYASLCSYMGEDPSAALVSYLQQVLTSQAENGGPLLLGPYQQSIPEENKIQVEKLLERVQQGDFFKDITVDTQVEEKLRTEMENIGEIAWIVDILSYAGYPSEQALQIHLKPGEQTTVELPGINQSRILVPIVPGRSYNFTLTSLKSDRLPTQDPEEAESAIFPETFPTENMLKPSSPDRRRTTQIVAFYRPSRFARRLVEPGSFLFDQLHGRPTTYLSDDLKKEVQRYLKETALGFDTEGASSWEVLRGIFTIVSNAIGNEERNDDNEQDFATLFHELQTSGKFDGDCKAVSTLVAGFCEALGYNAPRRNGRLTDVNSGMPAGHVWTEVYVPSVSAYVLLDPAGGYIGAYPKPSETVYAMEGFIAEESDAKKDITFTITLHEIN